MREIKFRAWDGEKITRSFTLENMNYEWLPLQLYEHEDTDRLKEWVAFMQYTWLKDENNKEVYEGDIILMSDEAYICPREYVIIEDYFGIYKAHPVNDRFYVGDSHELCRDHLWNFKPKHGIAGVVVWNIYENPDLLK